jgi:uncharacterized membrane protein
LFVVVSYAIGVSALLLALQVGSLAAIIAVFVLPGYAITACLFPSNKEIRWIERIALSFVLSFAAIPLLGLILSATPFGFTFASVVAATVMLTVLVGIAAYGRRMRLPVQNRLAFTLDLEKLWSPDAAVLDKALVVTVAASITAAVVTLAYIGLVPRAGEQYSEFYILGPGGNASDYPTSLKVSQSGTVILGIANHEAASVNYTVRADLAAVRIIYNATSGFNSTVEVNRTTWHRFNVTLPNGQNWTQPYTFRINYAGLWKVQFLLFKNGEVASAYRALHMYVRVS